MWSLREPWTETADPHMAELLGAIYVWMARQESARSERAWAGVGQAEGRGPPGGVSSGLEGPQAAEALGVCAGPPSGYLATVGAVLVRLAFLAPHLSR